MGDSGTTELYLQEDTYSALAFKPVPGVHGPHSWGMALLGDPEIRLTTVPKAIEFHRGIEGSRKQLHLQSLRNYWVERVRDLPGMQILTPDDTARHGAVTSFRLPAMRDYTQAQKMATLLLKKHRVLTVARTGIAQGSAVRVAPTLYNTHQELDRLVAALRQESGAFV
ncbi:hypothetical protein ACGH7X_38905 [Streptomyces sp. BBFR51]|uniref:hypothetical protein n=1 Tax=Streptomyces sp. BBFR51 TaxID=3372856 RepID=UPI0037DC52B8